MTTPSLTVSVAELGRRFTSNTIANGRASSGGRSVQDHEWSEDGLTLTGTVSGDKGFHHSYRQHIRFRGEPAVASISHTVCTCPARTDCKHVVALLLAASRATAAPAPAPAPALPGIVAPTRSTTVTPLPRTWRSAVRDIVGGSSASTNSGGKPLALAVGRTTPTRHGDGVLTLRPMTVGARGNWIKTGATWRDVVSPYAAGLDPNQQASLRAMYRVLAGGAYGYSSTDDTVSLAAPPRALWRLLTDVAADGVELIAEPSLRVNEIRVGRASLGYAITAHPDGAQLFGELVIDGEVIDAAEVDTIGLPDPHGVWRIADGVLTLAPLEQAVTAREFEALQEGSEIVIPSADLAEFSLDVLPNLSQRRAVTVADGVLTPPKVEGPEAVLTVTDSENGARYSWSVGYRVNDANVVFDPSQPIGATAYRDEAAEEELWTRITPDMQTVAFLNSHWTYHTILRLVTEARRAPTQDAIDAIERLDAAASHFDAVAEASVTMLRHPMTLTLPELAVLCGEVIPAMREQPDIRVDYRCADEYRPAAHQPEIAFSADDQPGNDWFGLEVTVTVGELALPIADVIAQLATGATHMLLPDNEYIALDTPELLRLTGLLVEARTLGEIDADRVSTRSLNATFWEELLALGVVDKQLEQWRQRMARLAKARPPRPVKPSPLLKADLRQYQQDGLNWLSFLWKNELGGVLADDMGLGKTVQTLALVARAVDADKGARFLVVAPTSVVPNWVAECRKFVPGLKVSAVTATGKRSEIPFDEQVDGAHIVVTSYTLLRLGFDDFDRFQWNGVIFDEAQFIKNHTGKTHQCARRIEAPFKLAITGTPMENNLMELWSLLSVTAPGLFPSPTTFTNYFRKPIESGSAPERLDTLRRRIKPLMLRRTKDQVAIDLPPKQEQAMVLDLSSKHRKIYDTRLARERQKVLGLLGDWEKNRFQVFRSLSMLRQLSLHAALVDSSHNAVNSAKVDYLSEQLPALVDEGHSALVFSQFTRFLDIVRAHLDEAGITYSYLDGSMSAKQRDKAVRQFTSGVNQVFLISLKAGGFGLNLTEADYCFVCDPWWNPAAEAQAVDRAHRIGQQRPVNVYRLVSADTIEERVVRLQERKRALFDAVVDDGELFGTALSAADIREMLA
ncbi:DEAD/DEAH box helicase [Gordonia sp. NPDC003585]|uniref:DEAD/DEAH box helicase n=1 Tax=Gordonia sp. NPDC003585 TaxID=3154275 RepID=UPI0033A909D3